MVMVKCHIWMVKFAPSPWEELRTSQDSTAGEKLDVLLGSICSCDMGPLRVALIISIQTFWPCAIGTKPQNFHSSFLGMFNANVDTIITVNTFFHPLLAEACASVSKKMLGHVCRNVAPKKICLSTPPRPSGHRSFKMKLDGRHLSLRVRQHPDVILGPHETEIGCGPLRYSIWLVTQSAKHIIKWEDMARSAFWSISIPDSW